MGGSARILLHDNQENKNYKSQFYRFARFPAWRLHFQNCLQWVARYRYLGACNRSLKQCNFFECITIGIGALSKRHQPYIHAAHTNHRTHTHTHHRTHTHLYNEHSHLFTGKGFVFYRATFI